jgi:putative inorganic carbon (hco3(-)) transporter
MLSLAIIFLIILCIPFAFRYPFFGLCLYIWLDYVAPDRMFSGVYSEAFRLSLMTIAVTLVGWLLFERNSKLGPSFALKLLLVFALWVSVTTVLSVYPITAALKYERFIKNVVIVILGVLLIDTKERLLIVFGTIFAATAIHSARGAAITIVTGGGGYAVVGTSGTYLEERNYVAMAFLMAVSFGIFLVRHFKRAGYPKWSRWVLGIATLCCMISTVGTQSRGALVAAGATALVAVLFAKRRIAALSSIFVMAIATYFLAPDAWVKRMRSIGEYSEDNASTSRLDTWKFAWDYALENPIFGGGFSIFLANKNETSSLGYFEAHSYYFEVLAEHGFVGLFIAMSMLTALFYSLVSGALRTKKSHDPLIPEMQFFVMTASVSLFVAGIFGILSPFLMTYLPIMLSASYQRIEYMKNKVGKVV